MFTRAPRITEDFDPSVALLLREMMEVSSDPAVLVDAHNSRFEHATASELNGVRFGSEYANEYIAAVKKLGRPSHKNRSVRIGVASADIYERLGKPDDLAEGKMNVIAFDFNGFTRALVCINGNNIMPSARAHIIEKVEKACRASCEICTTDTHAVNSLGSEADNVVGSKTDKENLSNLAVKAVRAALADIEPVVPYHRRTVMKRFRIWGPNNMEGIIATARALYGFLRIAIPLLIMLGFIAAAWVISVI
jgi:predicted neutral ceramidase superfamily lipid hydrolase